ncbi:MAG: hypothetical protein DRN49_00770 [Thaumarchaeota archaeon]|nr:MAG: hypothetical protein DRN49_00770 [Nitrososphaerota archaeon]
MRLVYELPKRIAGTPEPMPAPRAYAVTVGVPPIDDLIESIRHSAQKNLERIVPIARDLLNRVRGISGYQHVWGYTDAYGVLEFNIPRVEDECLRMCMRRGRVREECENICGDEAHATVVFNQEGKVVRSGIPVPRRARMIREAERNFRRVCEVVRRRSTEFTTRFMLSGCDAVRLIDVLRKVYGGGR